MTDRLRYAFLAADRLPPADQDELAGRILHEVAGADRFLEADRMVEAVQRSAAQRVAERLGPSPAQRG